MGEVMVDLMEDMEDTEAMEVMVMEREMLMLKPMLSQAMDTDLMVMEDMEDPEAMEVMVMEREKLRLMLSQAMDTDLMVMEVMADLMEDMEDMVIEVMDMESK